MDVVEFEGILKQVAPLTEVICLHLLGEPLAHPHLQKILEICEQYKTLVDLTTNGILIKKHKNLIIRSNCVRQINFSLQAFKDNFPDKDPESYLLPIFDFVKSAHESRPELYSNFRLWNQESNDSDNETELRKIESYFNITINRNIELGAIKSKKIWNRLYLNFDSRFEWPSYSIPNQGTKGRCHGTTNHIGIHADGTVVPCCLDKNANINLGNLKQESLNNILESDRFKNMREGFLNGIIVEDFCQHCSFINRFSKKEKVRNTSEYTNRPQSS